MLAAVEAKLDPVHARWFAAQVEEINYVQRRLGGREVGLYVIHSGRVRRNASLRFPMEGREWRLARARLHCNGAKWSAAVHLADGYLTSIEYDGPPPPADVEDATIDVEIFKPPPARTLRSSGPAPLLAGWLQRYASRVGITNIDPPLTVDDRAMMVAKLETKLPADYLDFLAQCDGVQIGSLSIVGASEAYETRTEDGEYIVIGQLGGKGALAVRKPGPAIVFMNLEEGSITDLGESLEVAIRRVTGW